MATYATVINGELVKIENQDSDALLIIVMAHLDKLNINYSKEQLITQIKRQSKNSLRNKKKIDMKSAIAGAKALVKFSIGDSASKEEIVRRSKICEECPLIEQTSGCTSCGASKVVAEAVMYIQKWKQTPILIPAEIKSQYCGVCDCSLAVMVATKYKDFDNEPNAKNLSRPDLCWLKTTSPNFTNE